MKEEGGMSYFILHNSSAARALRLVAEFFEDGEDGITVIALDFDVTFFERAARA